MPSAFRMWVNPHILVKWYLFKCHLWVGKKNIQPAKRRFDRRIGQLYDDLRRADFQGDKDAVASWTEEEVLGLQGFSKKGTVFNDAKKGGCWNLEGCFSQTYDVSCSFLVFFNLNFESFLFLKFNISKPHIYTSFFDSFQIQNLHVSMISILLAGGFPPRSNIEHRLWGWKAHGPVGWLGYQQNPWVLWFSCGYFTQGEEQKPSRIKGICKYADSNSWKVIICQL